MAYLIAYMWIFIALKLEIPDWVAFSVEFKSIWNGGINEIDAKEIEKVQITIITAIVKLTLHQFGGIGWVHRNHRSNEITIKDRDDAVQLKNMGGS